MPTYTLNFSEGSSMIVAQYYNIMRLGMEGYRSIVEKMMGNAHYLADKIKKLFYFDILNDARHIPVVTFKLHGNEDFDLFDLSYRLRERGWIVPAYSLPKNAEDTTIMRVVVRENFTADMVDLFVIDVETAFKTLRTKRDKISGRSPREGHAVS